ncbi:transcription termination factor NusB [Methanococcus voltae PS]|uniref:Transcription termination factor NusB n=1 Tax=Methanococcus voltae PS TaxID=523842 RepID=A0ABT2EWW6_METVO|nr:hypothetical protein [Methanococcus voltae]MCS3922448.1 transcription termination factor NusB [Methanococcus voltae PS]
MKSEENEAQNQNQMENISEKVNEKVEDKEVNEQKIACNSVLVDDNIIINSMKKVFDEELCSIHAKIDYISTKYNIKDSSEFKEKYEIDEKIVNSVIKNILEVEQDIENAINNMENSKKINELHKDFIKMVKYESDVRKVTQYMKELKKHC